MEKIQDPTAEKSLTPILHALVSHRDLTYEESYETMDCIMSGKVNHIQLSAFLAMLAAKGETVTEIHGLADAMRDHALRPQITSDVLDIVGTGGDGAHTVNISTMAAILAAGCGVPVVKHGNRASTSRCGSADVIEALGIHLKTSLDQIERTFDAAGIAFCFANMFHPSMRYAIPVRRSLGIPTVFNILGPLTNPVHARANAIGVYSHDKAALIAGVLQARGVDALVFRTLDPALDELSLFGVNEIWETHGGEIHYEKIDLREVVSSSSSCMSDTHALRGGDSHFNAAVAEAVIGGSPSLPAHFSVVDYDEKRYITVRETVLLNAAAGILAYYRHPGCLLEDGNLTERFRCAYQLVRKKLEEGNAQKVLDNWRMYCAESLS